MALQNDRPETRTWPSILNRRDWVYLLSLLIPVVVYELSLKALLVFAPVKKGALVDERALPQSDLITTPSVADGLRLMQSDLLFTLGYVLLWVGLFAMARTRPVRWLVVSLFHVVTILVVLITTVAYQYFKATGSTLDSNYLLFWLSSPQGTGDVIASEVDAGVLMVMVALLVYAVFGPWLVARCVCWWRDWRDGGARIGDFGWPHWARIAVAGLAAYTLFWFSLFPGGSTTGVSKSFSRAAFVNMLLTAAEEVRADDVVDAAEPPSASSVPTAEEARADDVVDATPLPSASSVPTAEAARADDVVDGAGPTSASSRPAVGLLPTASKSKRNVVLILLESTRADSTTPYNKDLLTTSFMDELAERSLLVENAYAIVQHTHNALAGTMCGFEPPIGPAGTELLSVPGSLPSPCLPHLLEDHGYNTVFFMSHYKGYENSEQIMENLGFDTFYSNENMNLEGFERTNYFGHEDEVMLEPSRQWLEEHRGKPFLATYLTSAPHHDYWAPSKRYGRVEFSKDDLFNRYLNSVRNQDFFLKHLFNLYKELGLYEDTVFIVLGDHGEGFGEHGLFARDVMYEEGVRIPLLIHDPKQFKNGSRIDGPASQLDILPTVADLLDYKLEGRLYSGRSLLKPIPDDRVVMIGCWREKVCLASISGTLKYIHYFDDRPDEIFDLATDPGERNNLAGQWSPEEVNKLRSQLLQWRTKVRSMYSSRTAER